MADTAQAQDIYLPWQWRIEPIASSNHKCPSRTSVLLTYLAVNFLTALLGIFLSHRTVVNILSCGCLGRDRSKSWTWMWIVQLGLHFGADLVVAYITTHSPGYNYETSPKTWDLALFYASRPRMAWIFLSLLGTCGLQMRKRSAVPSPTAERISPADNTRRADTELAAKPFEGHWTSAAKQTLIVEAIMQVVGSYYLGRTAHFAATHGYYHLHRNYDSNAKLMYGGALFTLIVLYISIFGIYGELAQLITRRPFMDSGSVSQPPEFVNRAFLLGYVVYIGTWLFWSGYVKLVGDGYCPPSLFFQGTIWVSMNVLGIVLGTGL